MRGAIMPTIRISDRSWERLKSWAEPLEDTADSALVKVLDAAERSRNTGEVQEPNHSPRSRANKRQHHKTPQDAFREPLLQVLYERGGSGRPKDLYLPLKQRMEDQLIADDLEHLASGGERWWKSVNWARFDLVQDGYLRNDSPRGVWALSEKGTALVESGSKETSGNFVDHLRAIPDAGDDSDFDRSSS